MNAVNGKIYYGVHKTSNLQDGYLGSGVALNRAVIKYGKENFSKEILYYFNSLDEMYLFEGDFITDEIVKDDMTYNLTRGGRGGFSHIDMSGDKNCMKNSETVKKVHETKLKNGSYHTELTIAARNKATENARIANTGKKKSIESVKASADKMKELWIMNKEEYRDKLASTFELTSPNGMCYITNRLSDFCKEHNLTYGAIWNTSLTNKKVSKGKSKGWICKKLK